MIIVGIVNALVFESVWQEGDCEGPPSSMSVYDSSIVENPFITITSNDFAPPACGYNPVAIYSGCCSSSLNLELSLGFQSWNEQEVDGDALLNAPVSANNYQYCVLNSLDPSSLYQYNTIYALANGQCTKDGIACKSNGDLHIFEDFSCANLSAIVNLNNVKVLPQSVLGNVTGDIVTVNSGSTRFTWVAFSPELIEIPQNYPHWLSIEVASWVLNFLSMILALFKVFAYVMEYKRTKAPMIIYKIINMIMWFVWVLASFLWYTVEFPTNMGWQLLAQFQMLSFNIASLMTAVGTAMFFLEIKHWSSQRNIFLTCIFGGSNYLAYFKYQPATTALFAYWSYFAPVWIISVYFFDTVPQLILVGILIRTQQLRFHDKSFTISLQKFLVQNPVYLGLITTHILNMTFFLVSTYLTGYSQYLGNDRAVLAMCGPLAFADTMHSNLNAAILAELKAIFGEIMNDKKRASVASRVKNIFSGKETQSSRGPALSESRLPKRKGQALEQDNFKFRKLLNEFTEDGIYFLNVDGK
ncbi:hypothetical protein HDV06_003170 [Boothiomyces sp. JEL0866]|nr:hypothetical protein HDV06_003170 [Boothiomyces sp. JEL0866]